jgi:hypothetical protein
MVDANTIFELKLACQKPGCPICALIQRAGTRYIEGIFTESLLDPIIRQNLVDSYGFCSEHAWQSIDLKLSDALGQAILYQDLVKDIMDMLQENGENPGAQLASTLTPVKTCPACSIEQVTLKRLIDSMTIALRNQDFVDVYNQSGGLCIPHLKQLLPKLEKKQQAVILSHQLDCMERLKIELAEFIRKSDYRFRDEIMGKEGDSYKRAADMICGKHRPTVKRDY